MTDVHAERILIIDFGSQVTQLIARRVRESGVYSEIHPYQAVSDAFLDEFGPKAVILSGGPASVTGTETPRAPAHLFEMGVPVLGICYGQQIMVAPSWAGASNASDGSASSAAPTSTVDLGELRDYSTAFGDPGEQHQVWMSHGDRVDRACPPGSDVVGISEGAPFAAIADDGAPILRRPCSTPRWCTRPTGPSCSANFVHRRRRLRQGGWTMAAFRDAEIAIAEARAQVGNGKVICGLSGGVDSFRRPRCCIHQAIGDQLHLHIRRPRLAAPGR